MDWTFTKAASLTAIGLLCLVTLGAQAAPKGQAPPELPYEGKDSVIGTIARIDVTCILRTWRIKGVLACTHGFDVKVCLWVENAWPSGLFEVIRQPYRTQMLEMSLALKVMEPFRGLGGSSSHSPVAGDGTTNQFAETRVYTFVPDLGLSNSDIPIAIPLGSLFQPNYVSELDGFGWRSPLVDTLTAPETMVARIKSCGMAPDPITCAGTWGTYFPRIGFINHPSQALAAAMQGLRAGRAASRPLGRVVLSPYPFEPRTGHFIQMVEPVPKPALSIGSPFPQVMDVGAGSPFGNYLFIHFGIFECCSGCLPTRLVGERPPQ
jgi:hypothetical protein